VLAGTITVQGGKLTSTGAVLTSLKEQTQLLPSCGSVFVPKASGVCSLATAGDWGGLVLDASKANTLTESVVDTQRPGSRWAPHRDPPGTEPDLGNSRISNSAADGVSTRSPVSITGGAFTRNGAHGIKVDLTDVASSAFQPLWISGSAISGSGQDGILAIGLAGQTVTIDQTSVDLAGAFGINLRDPAKTRPLPRHLPSQAGTLR